MNRVGSLPVHGSRYFRSTVSVSSPEIESSRSTAIEVSAAIPSRASEMTASGLPMSGCSPKFCARLASVGAATLCAPEQAGQDARDRPLAGTLRADQHARLLLRRWRSRARTRTIRRERDFDSSSSPQSSSRNRSQRSGVAPGGRTRRGARAARRARACAVRSLRVSRSRIPFASATTSPAAIGVVASPVSHTGGCTLSGCARSPSAPAARRRPCSAWARRGRPSSRR